MFRPEPPQGFSRGQEQVIIGRPTIPLFAPPQGFGGEGLPALNPIETIFPPIGDTDYQNYKFYQVNPGEIPTPIVDGVWEITDSVGPGTFQEASGFDVRAFDDMGTPLEYEVVSVNVTSGDLIIKVKLPILDDLRFIQLTFGNPLATDDSVTVSGTVNILSTHKTPLLTKDIPNLLSVHENWFDSTYKSRIPLTINDSQVPSAQTNFVMLINSTFPELIGLPINEIKFAGINRIQLDYEIQNFDSITGELIAWVRKPSVFDGDITYLYYDNPSSTDEQNPNAVWSDDITAYHLDKFVSGADGIKDLTANAIDGTTNNMDITNEVPGKIGNALNFDGTSESIELKISSILNSLTNDYIVSCWTKQPSGPAGTDRIMGNRVGSGFGFTGIMSATQIAFTTLGVLDYRLTVPTITFNVFHHVVIHLKSNNDTDFYFNGVFEGTVTGSSPTLAGIDEYHIGSIDGGTGNPFELYTGTIEMLEVTDTIPANVADKVKTQHNNQNAPETFYNISTKEELEIIVESTI